MSTRVIDSVAVSLDDLVDKILRYLVAFRGRNRRLERVRRAVDAAAD